MRKFLAILTALIFFAANSYANEQFSHGISIFGDLKYPKNFKYFDYVNPDAPKKGRVRLGYEGTFNSLNPYILKGLSAVNVESIYDSLAEASEDEQNVRYGLIAEGIKLVEDKKSLTFKLRKEARWHDGVPLNADDVIFTFETLIKEGHPSYRLAYRDIEKVQKIDDYQVKFIFKNANNRDLPLLVSSMRILPKHFYKDKKFDQTSLEIPLGSGPYKIEQIEAGKKIVFKRVENYWAKDLPVNKGRYNFDRIIFDYYRDSNVLIEAFKAGKFDFHQENISRNWHNSYNIKKVANGEIIKKEIIHSNPMPTQTFVINLRKEKFQNAELRKALTFAFNFEWLKKHIFYSSYQRLDSYFANSNFAYKDFQMPISNADDFGRDNLIIAKKILDKAGYQVHNGHLIDPKTKQPITIEFLIHSENFEMVIAPFVKNLKKLGIDAKVRLIEMNQFENKVRNFDFDIIVSVFSQASLPGSELIHYWHSKQKDVKGSRNLSGLNDKKVDYLVEKIAKTTNRATLIKLCQELDRHLLENYYTILQWYNNSYRILYWDIFAMPKITPKYALGFDNWWIKE